MLSFEIIRKEIDKMESLVNKICSCKRQIRKSNFVKDADLFLYSLCYNNNFNSTQNLNDNDMADYNEIYDIEVFKYFKETDSTQITLGVRLYTKDTSSTYYKNKGLEIDLHSTQNGNVYTLSGNVSAGEMLSEEEYFLKSVNTNLPEYRIYEYVYNFIKRITYPNTYIICWFNTDYTFDYWNEIDDLVKGYE